MLTELSIQFVDAAESNCHSDVCARQALINKLREKYRSSQHMFHLALAESDENTREVERLVDHGKQKQAQATTLFDQLNSMTDCEGCPYCIDV